MTIAFTVYDEVSGQIIRTGSTMTEATALAQAGTPGTKVVLVGSDPVTEQIDPAPEVPVVIPRPVMGVGSNLTVADKTEIASTGLDQVTITNIPVGAKGEVFLPANMGLQQPADIIINDGILYFTSTVAGIFSIRISFLNYIDFTVTINAI